MARQPEDNSTREEQRSAPVYDDFIYDDFSDRNNHYPRFKFPEAGTEQGQSEETETPAEADESAEQDDSIEEDIVERMRRRRGAAAPRIRMDEEPEKKKGISGKLRKFFLWVISIVLLLFQWL